MDALRQDWLEEWYAGRPFIVNGNDRGLRLWNGDTGVTCVEPVTRRDAGNGSSVSSVTPASPPRSLATTRLADVSTAHAMTVHRSQGSQFDEVTVLLPEPDSRILTRELFYTAVTRARSVVRVVGSEESLRAAVTRRAERATGLAHRLGARLRQHPRRSSGGGLELRLVRGLDAGRIRPGSVNDETRAPTRQSAPMSRQEVCRPARKASCMALVRADECAATAWATATESCAVPAALREPGRTDRRPGERRTRWRTPSPTTATPRVPPSSRVASLTAEPTPARAGGRTSRIDSVAGVEMRPMPSPIMTICGTITVGYDAATSTVEIQRKAEPKSTIPAVTTACVPTRGASAAPSTEATAMLTATGRMRAPVERLP